MEADRLVQQLGGCGRWQMLICALHGLVWASLAVDFSVGPYIVDTPPYRCKIPANSTFNDTIPATWEDGVMTWHDTCSEYVNRSESHRTQPCTHGYWFDPEYGYESTVTTDFQLVCGKEIYIEVTMMIKTIVLGLLALGINYCSDRFGRKSIYMVGIIARPIFLIIRSQMPNFYLSTAFEMLTGLAHLCFMNNAFLLVTEMMAANKRTRVATSMEVFWAMGLVAATPLLYFVRNWRTIQLVLAVPSFLVYIAFLAPESITWLISKGKTVQIERIIRQAAWVNGIPPQEEAICSLKESKAAEMEPLSNHPKEVTSTGLGKAPRRNTWQTLLDLVRTPRVRLYTLVQIFIWFTNAFVYVALNLTMTYMPGNRYVNFLFYALAELMASFLHVTLLMAFGRRLPLFGFHVTAGVGLMLTIVEVFKGSLHFNWVPMVVAFNVLGKLGISASFMTIYLYTPEMYPTQIRSLAIGVCQTFAMLSHIISPYARVLEREKPGMLRGICGVMCIIAGFLGLLLPETHRRPLPETIEDVEIMPRNLRKRSKSSTKFNDENDISVNRI